VLVVPKLTVVIAEPIEVDTPFFREKFEPVRSHDEWSEGEMAAAPDDGQ
jgi:hypothetical protein